jgi:hypothetical protein
MPRRAPVCLLLVLAAQAAYAQSAPRKMAVSGDSLSQGALADGIYPGDQPWNSWAQGTTSAVDSVWSRYRTTLNPYMALAAVSEDGAKMTRDFARQAEQICAQSPLPNRVFVLLGQNDACYSPRSSTDDAAAGLPTPEVFRSALHNGLTVLDACLPKGSVVHVVSVIRVDFLYEAGYAEDPIYCPLAWRLLEVCPTVTLETNPDRRLAIGQRIDAWNWEIAHEVSELNARKPSANRRRILYVTDWQGTIDEGQRDTSAGTYVFGSPDINGLDCFHASVRGQRKLACAEWAKSLDGAPLYDGTVQSCFQ